MAKTKRIKKVKTITLTPAVFEAVKARVQSGSDFSKRVDADLARYDRLVQVGMASLSKSLQANEVLYLLKRLYGEHVDNVSLRRWLQHGLQDMAYDFQAEDVFDEEFQLDRQVLCEKIEGFTVLERMALIEYIEQVSQIKTDKAKVKAVNDKFQGG